MNEAGRAPKLLVVLALGTVYLVWGSTYLGIRFAIESIPPFTMAGIRFTVAGWVLYGILRMRGHSAPSRTHWLSAALLGTLLLGIGNGGVTWAETRVPSGIAALIVAGTPAWMVLLDWARPGGTRPGGRVVLGVVLGLLGIALLVLPGQDVRAEEIDMLGALVVMTASLSWAVGSIASRFLRVPGSAMQVTSMQMIAAGAGLVALGFVSGEWGRIDLTGVTPQSALALAYLVVFGSWIGFSAYVWLLKSTTAAIASTYAYVNPAVALFLGWALAGEVVDRWTLGAMGVIVAGVALITIGSSRRAAVHGGGGTPRGPSGSQWRRRAARARAKTG